MSDKRSVKTDALETLGTIIDENGARDAIHLAVEPVIAGTVLYPGQDVGLVNGKASIIASKLLGIVDPFLKAKVLPGERFWLVLYPRQITSLRHVWSHPDFAEPTVPPVSTAASTPNYAELETLTKKASEEWLRNFCRTNDAPDYEGMMALIRAGQHEEDDEYFHVGDLDAHCAIPEEFWHHVEIVTGRVMKVKPEHFSCAC